VEATHAVTAPPAWTLAPVRVDTSKGSQLVDWCLTTLSPQTRYIVLYEYEICHVGPGDKAYTIKQ